MTLKLVTNKTKIETPKVNYSYKPTYNGCGSYGFKLNFDDMNLTGFTNCCNVHDVCYGTCNLTKKKCDDDFQMCLFSICSKLKKLESAQQSNKNNKQILCI